MTPKHERIAHLLCDRLKVTGDTAYKVAELIPLSGIEALLWEIDGRGLERQKQPRITDSEMYLLRMSMAGGIWAAWPVDTGLTPEQLMKICYERADEIIAYGLQT